jgi:predicted unusual protein kinase regulating ubiquinone biosynthesis (AarF/ABC1/UbiB family)
VRELLGAHLTRPLAQISYGDILADIIRLAIRHRLRLPRELVLVAKQAIYFERYAKLIAPELNIFERPDILRYLLDGLVDQSLVDSLPAILALVQASGAPAELRAGGGP